MLFIVQSRSSNTLRLVGQAEYDISLQVADYEQCLDESVISPMIQMIDVSLHSIMIFTFIRLIFPSLCLEVHKIARIICHRLQIIF